MPAIGLDILRSADVAIIGQDQQIVAASASTRRVERRARATSGAQVVLDATVNNWAIADPSAAAPSASRSRTRYGRARWMRQRSKHIVSIRP